MNIKNCKSGLVVKSKEETESGEYSISKGEELTIKNVFNAENSFANHITFEEIGGSYYPDYFELTHKFDVGDPVIYHSKNGDNYQSEIWAIDKNGDYLNRRYAIKYKPSTGDIINTVAAEKDLSLLKKPSELEPGDKFIPDCGNVSLVIILASAKYKNKSYYLCNVIGEDWIYTWSEDCVKAVIYD